MEFTLLQEARILYGAGKVQETGALLRRLGVDKALVVCDEGVKKAGIVERVTNSLTQAQVEFALFDKVQADPPSEVVDEGAAFCRAERCGAVIAVGGGSSIDTAKGINLLRCNPGKIMDYAGQKNEMKKAGGLVAVPTTAGTGSELSDGLVITSPEHVKCPILATNAMAEYIVLDPLLTVGLPAEAYQAIDGHGRSGHHSVESYTSTAASVPTDQISEGNIRSVRQWLPLAVSYPDAVKPRERMAVASMLGGWMLRYGHTHAGHSVAHILGARCGIPHGYACAYALPWVLEFNAPALPEKTAAVGRDVSDVHLQAPKHRSRPAWPFRRAVIAFRDETLRLRPISGFAERPDDGMLDRMAAEIEMELFQAFNPRRMKKEDARIILENIFS